MLIPMEAANSAVLAVVEQEVLHPNVTDVVVKKAIGKFRASQQDKQRKIQQYDERLKLLETEVGRLVDAISAGGDIPPLVEALKASTERQAAVSHDRAELSREQNLLTEGDYSELEAEIRTHFRQSWVALMTRQVAQARQILTKLFNGERVPFSPAGSGYEFKGMASVGKLLIGRAKVLVSPTGFEPVLLP